MLLELDSNLPNVNSCYSIMCSVVGYVGKNYSRSFIMQGLTRLEYRGYDSAGFTCLNPDDNQVLFAKAEGGVANLTKSIDLEPIDGYIGLGHTRWSTHGAISYENAHPQFDCLKKLAIVHNGIIENHHVLRAQLVKEGHTFLSETDTEVIAHLVETLFLTFKDPKQVFKELLGQLEGAFAFALIHNEFPDTIFVVRKRSPLCIGQGEQEMFVASDLLAFAHKTNKVLFLPDESFALIRNSDLEVYDRNGHLLNVLFKQVDVPSSSDLKQGYEHFMLKEIYDQKKVIQDTVHKYRALEESVFSQMNLEAKSIQDLQSIVLVACGTSWHAGLVAKFFFESIAQVKTEVGLGSEIRYETFFPEKNRIVIGISQSGETADTLESLRFFNENNQHTIALVNVASSTMVRETKGYLPLYAGPEVAVASTKAFSAQVAALYWLAHKIALEKGLIQVQALRAAEDDLLIAAEILENTLEIYKNDILERLAPLYASYPHVLFLGRHISYPFAQEAALKLKEISYIFCDSYPSAELKHGPLALVDANTPVFLFSILDKHLYPKLVANAQEVKARKGHLLVFAFEGQKELIELADTVFIIPLVKPLLGPLAMTGLMQFFVYALAKVLGRPIDKPRNLAKSLTVE